MSTKIFREVFSQVSQLHVRTDSYKTLGYTMGRTFKSMIEDAVRKMTFLEQELLPVYNSEEGKKIYNFALALCQRKFPQYVEELEGMALASEIPFHKLFLLHIDSLMLSPGATFPKDKTRAPTNTPDKGCTAILSFPNQKNAFLGHNEDGAEFLRNNVFLLNAEILDKNNPQSTLEKFSTLVYAGFIAGGTMGFNEHGLIHSVNTLVPLKPITTGTPILFLLRAVLSAKSLEEVVSVLRDEGSGSSDGASINVIYVASSNSAPTLVNIEVAPKYGAVESDLNIHIVPEGGTYEHCNRYLRIDVAEQDRIEGSICRHKTIKKYANKKPYDYNTITEILSDQSSNYYPIYRNADLFAKDSAYTLIVGIAETETRSWALYVGQPSTSLPLVILPMNFKFDKIELKKN